MSVQITVRADAVLQALEERITEWVGIRVHETLKHQDHGIQEAVLSGIIDAAVDGAFCGVLEVLEVTEGDCEQSK